MANWENILKQYHQEQLLRFENDLTQAQWEHLQDQMTQIDFDYINQLYQQKDHLELENKKITPMGAIEKEKINTAFYESIGKEAIQKGKLAICSMAGGQGTRLGYAGPKGTFMLPVTPPISIFETMVIKLKKAYEEYGVYIDWYIMTSHQNHEETVSFFESHDYFGYPQEHVFFFPQGELPLLDAEGKIVLREKNEVFMAPDGNGGIFRALGQEGILQQLKEKGVVYLAIGNVDNILIHMVDPVLVGLMIEKQTELASKSFMKPSPEGKWGVFCRMNGKPRVIEYMETPRELLEARNEEGELIFGDAHFGCNFFSVAFLEKIVTEKLPMHAALKKNKVMNEQGELEEEETYKFEAFIFDAFEKAENVLIFRTKREEEFAPIKNKEGSESPTEAVALYQNFLSKRTKMI